MSARDFIHLHTHSHYSLLEALPNIPDLVAAAKADGQTALALTDNGNMYGAIEFYKECKKNGIKPIIGVDMYVAPRTRHDKEHRIDDHTFRLVLLVKDEAGYRNLLRLVSKAYIEGFYYRPRVDRELLQEYRVGLIAILPSFSGEHARALKDLSASDLAQAGDATDKARLPAQAGESLDWYKHLYGEDLYLEITHHPEIEGHEDLQKKIIKLGKEMHVPLVAAHDTYYLKQEDAIARELVNKIRTGGTLNRDLDDNAPNFSFIPKAEAINLFKDTPEALDNTIKIADQCDLTLNLGSWLFPDFPIPAGTTHDAELREFTYHGFERRNIPQDPEIVARVDYELKVIADKGYSPYFLVVSDLLRHAKSAGIFTNTRGSAAGSLVSYLTGITTVDPLEYQLPFERFLNPERPSPPDVDMDIADNRRDDMIAYARQKYGDDHVAQIGTFGTMMARAAVRDVSRALGHSYALGDKIAKIIPFGKQGFPVTIAGSLEEVPELAEVYKTDSDAREILDLAQKVEGNARHVGVHAAGVVIAPTPVTDFVPIQFDPKGGKMITQYDMHAVEEAGLLKFDFLGLTNLSVLADAVARVRDRLGIEIDIDRLPQRDEKTFGMLSRGETLGVFQMASAGMTNYLMKLKPTRIDDLNVMVALYRPGPMNNIDEYIARKNGTSRITYLHPKMESYLAKTFGVLVYQDDLLMTAIELAGYTWGEVDKFRKAVGKKIPEEMAKQHVIFVEGCQKHTGMNAATAEKLWELFEPFQGYGFNKCVTGDTVLKRATQRGKNFVYEDVAIRNIHSGDVILAFDECNDSFIDASVRELIPQGIRPVFRLTTAAGKVIRATTNHPLIRASVLPSERIAIFIDGANFEQSIRTIGGRADYAGILKAFPGAQAYVFQTDFNTPAQAGFFTRIKKLGYRLITKQVKVIRKHHENDGHKANFDVEIAVEAVARAGSYDTAVLFSGDSDFDYLVRHLKRQGKRVVVISPWKRTARELRHSADLYFNLKQMPFVEMNQGTGSGRNERGPRMGADHDRLTPAISILAQVHPFVKGGQWTVVENLREGDMIATANACDKPVYERIIKIEHMTAEQVWDVEVDGAHTFIGNGIVAHNSHAASYGNLAYQTAYMKANFPVDYMAAVLTAAAGDVDEIAAIVAECKRMGIAILPPSINESRGNFTVVAPPLPSGEGQGEGGTQPSPQPSPKGGGSIRFGLYSIKNFGTGVGDSIIAAREEGGAFKDIADFLSRIPDKNLNKKSLEALIQCGAMDDLGERGSLLAHIEMLLGFHREYMKAPSDQGSLFGGLMATPTTLRLPPAPAASKDQCLAWEKELLGLYISGHPLDKHRSKLSNQKTSIKYAKENLRGVDTVIGGFIETVQTILTKKGEKMAFLKLADLSDSIEVVIFPRTLKESESILVPGSCVALRGKLSERNGEASFVAEKAKAL